MTTKEIAIIAFVLYALAVTLYVFLFTKKLKKWPYVVGELTEISIGPTVEFRTFAGRVKYTDEVNGCLLYTSPSPRDKRQSRMPSSA